MFFDFLKNNHQTYIICCQICRKRPAMIKYVQSEIISVIDAIIGPAISAGSMPMRFATIGSIEPMSFAMMTMSIIETHTVMATIGGL